MNATEPLPLHYASRIHSTIGRLFIAPTDSIGMPSSFYHLQPDRPMPQISELDSRYERNAIAVDFVRRELMQRMGPVAVGMSIALSVVLALGYRGLVAVLT